MSKKETSNSEVRAGQVATKKYQPIKLGLDIHADSIMVVRIIENAAPQPAQKFTPEKFLVWVKTQGAQAEVVHSCYEAGTFGFVLHRQLTGLGVKNLVVQAVCLGGRRTGGNKDKRDARGPAQRVDRDVAGNGSALATVGGATPQEGQRRVPNPPTGPVGRA